MMRLSIDNFFNPATMKSLAASYGTRRARLARERMTPLIERARKAEADGRIADMWPSLATDTGEDIRAGKLTMAIIYRPVTDGEKGLPKRWVTTILQAETNENDRPSEETERPAVEG